MHWAGLPDREEAGSPNVIGAVAMAAAAQTLMGAGMDSVERDEVSLLAYAYGRLHAMPGVTVYGVGDVPPALDDRVGVIAFNVGSLPHSLVAAILGYEAGIGVRSGCFCAQSYVGHLLGRTAEQQHWSPSERLAAQRAERPGMVRVSLGLYNTRGDIDALVDMWSASLEMTFAVTTAGHRGAGTTDLWGTKTRSSATSRCAHRPHTPPPSDHLVARIR